MKEHSLESCESSRLLSLPTGLGRHTGVFMCPFQNGPESYFQFTVNLWLVKMSKLTYSSLSSGQEGKLAVGRLRGFHPHFAVVLTSFHPFQAEKDRREGIWEWAYEAKMLPWIYSKEMVASPPIVLHYVDFYLGCSDPLLGEYNWYNLSGCIAL